MYFISIFVISQPIDKNAKLMAQLSLFVSLVNFPKSLLWRVIRYSIGILHAELKEYLSLVKQNNRSQTLA